MGFEEEHGGAPETYEDVTQEDYSYLPFTKDGHLALYGDTELHESLQLPDSVKVAQTAAGVIHGTFSPVIHTHEAGVTVN